MTLLPNEQLLTKLEKMTPIVFSKGEAYVHTPLDKDLGAYSYIWCDPEGDPLPPLKEVASITTFHTYGHPNNFKPSIAEVLTQLDLILEGHQFYFNTRLAEDGAFTSDESLHRGKTTFYTLA